jgi:HAD superfamily 5'-nucleotidase-like hydrolase
MMFNSDLPPADSGADPLAEAVELLRVAGQPHEVHHAAQVYVNRDLRMSAVDWIGFDMDYTLALYRQAALDELSVKHTLDSLIEAYGYPPSIRAIEPDPDFAIRGLVIDIRLGNILKMDSHYYVGKAFHGFEPVSREVKRAYQNEPAKIHLDRYVLVDTLFSLPETFLYAAVIDHLERRSATREGLSYERVYRDVRAAIDLAHADGRIKREILQDLPRYVIRDPDLATTLHKFRSAGKRLFLLTNSEWYYTSEVMSYLLDRGEDSYPSWRHYFDVTVTSAKKPAFFRGDDPFVRLDDQGQAIGPEREAFRRGHVYQGGNVNDLERMLGIRGSAVLYVGDHIYGDIVRSKRDSAWRTCMIIQEMEGELKKRDLMRERIDRWVDLDMRLITLNSELSASRAILERLVSAYPDETDLSPDMARKIHRIRGAVSGLVEQQSRERRSVLSSLIDLDDEIAKHFNPYWGLLFKEGAEHSIFGGQVESYACLYTSRVSNFRYYSPLQYFRARRQVMPHEI